MTRVLVWQWGRRGAGPRFAAELSAALRAVPLTHAALSLSAQAELLREPDGPVCELPVATYRGFGSFAVQCALAPARVPALAQRVRALRPDVALCAMAGPLDLMMVAALRRARVPFAVVVHDAERHPGDGYPMQMTLQRAIVRRADALVTLTTHVAERVLAQGLADDGRGGRKMLVRSRLPPFPFGPPPPPPRAHGGPLRLLSFGRLRPYKGLDLLAEALTRLGPRADLLVRVVGHGPESPPLDALRLLPGVTVENRWVPEGEVGALMAWADAMVLPYREASQSGAAAAALAAGRWVVATRVGGMHEQLRRERLARFANPTAESLATALADLLEAPPPLANHPYDVAAEWAEVAADLAASLSALARRGPGRR
jgi:glycosyltransferase involved in cell wall biosynthesis